MVTVSPPADSSRTPRRQREGELLAGCRAGDPGAWEQLLEDYERLVYSIPLRYGLSREAAADVVQQVFTALLQGLDGIREEDKLGSWLATVARRESWRQILQQRRESAAPEVWPAPLEDPAERWVRLHWLHEGLLALDQRCRELLTALYLSGAPTSYAEVARRLGRPIGSIGPTRARCLARLRELLEASG
jgi:RNA polymerase sigma factor (sigma-70 family)